MSLLAQGAAAGAPDPAAGAGPVDAGGDVSDMSKGYCIEISVLPDGTFNVGEPESLEEENEEEQGGAQAEGEGADDDDKGTDYQSVSDMLKGVLKIVQSNPVGDNPQAQFSAGYKGA